MDIKKYITLSLIAISLGACTPKPVNDDEVDITDNSNLIENEDSKYFTITDRIVDGVRITLSYKDNGINLSIHNQSNVNIIVQPNYASMLRFLFLDANGGVIEIRGWEGHPPPSSIKIIKNRKETHRYENKDFYGGEEIMNAAKICYKFSWKNSEKNDRFKKETVCIDNIR